MSGDESGDLIQTVCCGVAEAVARALTCATAVALKTTYSVFRTVNIALLNELKQNYEKSGNGI
jgi:UDP-N-acetyl-D-mannosaminuronate dehydrogenase